MRSGLVLLVQEPDFFTGELAWALPSGRIEDGETPSEAAARELTEEAGCDIDPGDLQLFAVAEVRHQGELLNKSWNFTAETAIAHLGPAVPDELVVDARWFERADAIRLVSQLSYSPKREPAVRFLNTGERGLCWTFELSDAAAAIPSFDWSSPARW